MKKMVLNNDLLFGNVTALLNEGKKVTIPVKGYSMLPFIIGERDLVVLEKPQGEVKKDDIILFTQNGRWVLHRVLEVKDGIAIIQGDGIIINKETADKDHIYGKVIKILRHGKREVEPYSPSMLKRVHLWQSLGKLRRYPLWILRHIPGIKSKTI